MLKPAVVLAARPRHRDFAWAVQVSAAASLAAVVHAVLIALRRRDGWYTLAFRALVWGPISATLPGSVALVAVSGRRWLQKRQGRSLGMWVWALFRGGMRIWVILEVVHFILFRIRLRTLSRQRHLPPRTRQAHGRRLATLRRCLRSLELAMQPERGDALAVPTLPAQRLTGSMPRCGTSSPTFALPEGSDDCSDLRRSASTTFRPLGTGLKRSGSSANNMLPSAESLIRQWGQGEGSEPDDAHGEDRMLQLKCADISGWFCGADVTELGRNNLREWITENFFHNATPEEVALEDREELEEMVDAVAEWIGLPDMPNMHNPVVQCKRLSRDPVKAVHRPFWIYGITGWVVPMVTEVLCHRMGFQKFTAGVIQYWHRPAWFPVARKGKASRSVPVVFCHGLGIGVLPYIQFVQEIGASGLELFLLDLPHISLRQDSAVPSPRETVACVVDMLAAWDHSEAHFIGHSFGSIVVSWMLQNSRVVTSASLLDPVCFLLAKHDIMTNSLYRDHEDPLQVTLTYLVFRELYVAHALARNFFWQQNDLAPESIQRPTLVLLSGGDAIVPAHSVKRLLQAEQDRRKDFKRVGHSTRNQIGRPTGSPLKGAAASTSCVELTGMCVESETESRIAATPLEVLWYPDIVHCEFIALPHVRRGVVQAMHKLFCDVAASR